MFVNRFLSALCVLTMAITACQTVPYQPYAREVKKRSGIGGTVAMKVDRVPADEEVAAKIMKTNCGTRGYTVIEEGEVIVGKETSANSSNGVHYGKTKEVGRLFGAPIIMQSDPKHGTQTQSVETNLKEWQVSYECEKARIPATSKKTATK